MTEQELPAAIRKEIETARARREAVAQDNKAMMQRRDTEYVPLWDRITQNRMQDRFGDSIDESMTRKRLA